MNDLAVVKILDPEENLVHEVPRLRLGHGLATLVKLHQRPTPAEF